MEKPLSQFERVRVVFEKRSDGGLRVYSQDVPGFILSHEDLALVTADVIPALEVIIGEIVGQKVRISLESDHIASGSMPLLHLSRESISYTARLAA